MQFNIHFLGSLLLLSVVSNVVGCGTTLNRDATQQLLTSDAVDRSISQIDFRVLSGERVFLDTQYIKAVKGTGNVNSEYVISSLRQQLIAARCFLQDKAEDSDFVVEPRVGTLGSDHHEVVYGIPANNALGAASSVVPGAPPVPPIPELSLAKRDKQAAAAKVAVFAYHRETKQPVWQSGIVRSKSNAKNTWLLGAGPIQRGTIYDGVQFAGSKLKPSLGADNETATTMVPYSEERHFPFAGQQRFADDQPPGNTSIQQAGQWEEPPASEPKP